MAGPLPLNTETHLHHSLCWVSACLNQCGCTRRYDLMAQYFPIYSPGNPGSSPGRKTKVKPWSKCDMPRNTWHALQIVNHFPRSGWRYLLSSNRLYFRGTQADVSRLLFNKEVLLFGFRHHHLHLPSFPCFTAVK